MLNFQKNIGIIAVAATIGIIGAAAGYFVFVQTYPILPSPTPTEGVFCTLDAKLCPDGSYVGRTGPRCEFAPCPSVESGISGKILVGPTCPVMREGDLSCADKPYQGEFIVKNSLGLEITRFSTDVHGNFLVALAPGTYLIEPVKQIGLGKQFKTVQVKSGTVTEVVLVFDTGIR